METKTKEKTTKAEAAAPVETVAIYEVVKTIEMDGMIYYPTHRLSLTAERARQMNELQAETVKFVAL